MIVYYLDDFHELTMADCTNEETLALYKKDRCRLMQRILLEGIFLDSPEGIWIPPHRILRINL